MDSQSRTEKRIKRLEIAVTILSILFITSIGVSIYSAMQIRAVASKVPSYQEIKNDIKTLNNLYKISEQKIPAAYDYTKDKAVKVYDYTKVKAEEFYDATKEKRDELMKYIKENNK